MSQLGGLLKAFLPWQLHCTFWCTVLLNSEVHGTFSNWVPSAPRRQSRATTIMYCFWSLLNMPDSYLSTVLSSTQVQFVWLVGWLLLHLELAWSVADTQRVTLLKKTDFPCLRSNQLLIAPQVWEGLHALFLSLCYNFAWLEVAQALSMLSQSLWVHMFIWPVVSENTVSVKSSSSPDS